MNQGISMLHPDIMMQKLISNYKMAKKTFGETLIRAATTYDPDFIEKNKHIPEFQRDLKSKLTQRIKELRNAGLLDKDNEITDKGYDIASLSLYVEELEQIPISAHGERVNKIRDPYGIRQDTIPYKHGFRFRDINVSQTVRNAIRHQHNKIQVHDIRVFERRQIGSVEILYCIDTSASMRGDKLKDAKKAGLALAFHAVQKKDKVGVIGFSTAVGQRLPPSHDFSQILSSVSHLTPGGQTNIAHALSQTIDLFSPGQGSKHVVLITDALPTFGEKPIEETLNAVREVRDAGITISLIAINLDKEGEIVANNIVTEGAGRLYSIKQTSEIDRLILEDYYNTIAN